MIELTDYLAAGQTTVSNLLLTYYQRLGMTNDEFLIYLQLLKYQQEGINFPDMTTISEEVGLTQESLYGSLEGLLNKKMIAIVTSQNEHGKTMDAYDVTLAYDRLSHYLTTVNRQEKEVNREAGIQALYQLFEKEFGRPLSPIELETIGLWLTEDHYDPEIIRLGLREAVLNQAYSLKYIDRVLLSWERKNLRSKEQVVEEQNRRKKTLNQTSTKRPELTEADLPKVPLYNWLDPGNQSE